MKEYRSTKEKKEKKMCDHFSNTFLSRLQKCNGEIGGMSCFVFVFSLNLFSIRNTRNYLQCHIFGGSS